MSVGSSGAMSFVSARIINSSFFNEIILALLLPLIVNFIIFFFASYVHVPYVLSLGSLLVKKNVLSLLNSKFISVAPGILPIFISPIIE